VTGTEYFTPYPSVLWTQATALAFTFTVEMEEQFKSYYGQVIRDQLAQQLPLSTNTHCQELTALTMTGTTIGHELISGAIASI